MIDCCCIMWFNLLNERRTAFACTTDILIKFDNPGKKLFLNCLLNQTDYRTISKSRVYLPYSTKVPINTKDKYYIKWDKSTYELWNVKLNKLIAWSSFWYNMQILNFYWSFSIKRSPSSNNIFAIIFKWTNNFSLIAPTFITFIRSDENFSIVSILALKFASIWRTCGALLTFQVQTTFCNDRVVCTI